MYNFKAGSTAALQKFCQFNFMCGVQCTGDGDGDGGSGGRVSCVRLKQKNCVFHKWKTWIEFPDFTSSSSDFSSALSILQLSFVWQKTWAPTFDTTAHTHHKYQQ